MSAWQPISTAPKDGTPLLIWTEGAHLIHLFWKNDHWEWLGGGRCPDGQYHMTHWMPLPEPPAPSRRTE